MIKVGVVGAGTHSRKYHGPSLRACAAEHSEDVQLVSVCDLALERAEAYASDFGFREAYADFREMLQTEELDALVAVTPVEATRPVVGELLTFGCPTLLEKPPGESPADTCELMEIASRHNTPVQVSFNRRCCPALTRATEWLEENAPGGQRFVAARMRRNRRLEERFVKDTGIHAIDTVLSLTGVPAELLSRRWVDSDGGQCCLASLRCEGDIAGSISIVPNAGCHTETYEIVGPGYSALVDTGRCATTIRQGGETAYAWEAPPEMPEHVRSGAYGENKTFLDSLSAGEQFVPDLRESLVSMQATAAIDAGGQNGVEI